MLLEVATEIARPYINPKGLQLRTSGIRHIYATDGSFMAFTAEDAGGYG